MSRAILMFRLPQEGCEHKIAVNAMDWALSCLEMDNWLRGQLKYCEAPSEYEVLREKLWEILKNHGVSLEDIE